MREMKGGWVGGRGRPSRRTDTYRLRTRPLRPPCSASSKIARRACVPPGDGQSQGDTERGGSGGPQARDERALGGCRTVDRGTRTLSGRSGGGSWRKG